MGILPTVLEDPILFTPGPLMTSRRVKEAMLRDLGSRDFAFLEIVCDIRRRLLEVAGVSDSDYTVIPIQGSGMFGIEAVVASTIPPHGKLLALVNGAYGQRLIPMTTRLQIDCKSLIYAEDCPPDTSELSAVLAADPAITHVAVVHCETTSGIMNPVEELGAVVKQARKCYIVDAMITFGATPLDIVESGIDYLISSPNKCLEALAGFAFVVARKDALVQTKGYARSLTLDLFDQWQELEQSGQFRFTPPIHPMLALQQALIELEEEGGVEVRAARYRQLQTLLVQEMQKLGFHTYLPPELQSHVVTSFLYPDHPYFVFETLYERMHNTGYVIYPGKVQKTFRLGTMGQISEQDVHNLIVAFRETLQAMEREGI